MALIKYSAVALFLAIGVLAPAATHKSAKKKTSGTRAAVTTKTGGKKSKSTAAASPMLANSWRTHQQTPTPERYKEIQSALAAKGYLKSEPTGVWNSESSDALRQYQTENQLSPTGKLSSRTLIGLGLGGSAPTTPPVATPPATPPVTQPTPPTQP